MIPKSRVPTGDLSGRPSVSPHHPLVVYLPKLSELLDKVVDVFAAQARSVRIRGRTLYEGIGTRLGQVVLRRCCVPKSHEQELRIKSLFSENEGCQQRSGVTRASEEFATRG